MMKLTMTLAGVVLVAGCMSPKDYETTPVTVNSAAGPVTCQLYTPGQVTWDRAIDHPGNMSVAVADDICRKEGYRRMNAGRTPAKVTATPATGDVVVVDTGL